MREQIKWSCLFFTKDRDSFEDCLRENDVIPDKNERDRLKNVFKIGHIQSLSRNAINPLAIICYPASCIACYYLL